MKYVTPVQDPEQPILKGQVQGINWLRSPGWPHLIEITWLEPTSGSPGLLGILLGAL